MSQAATREKSRVDCSENSTINGGLSSQVAQPHQQIHANQQQPTHAPPLNDNMQKIKSVLHRDNHAHANNAPHAEAGGRDMAHVGTTGVPDQMMPANLNGTVLPAGQTTTSTTTTSSNGILDDTLTLPQYMQSKHHKVSKKALAAKPIPATSAVSQSTVFPNDFPGALQRDPATGGLALDHVQPVTTSTVTTSAAYSEGAKIVQNVDQRMSTQLAPGAATTL
ncbi:hypothetical protein PROFUN_07179 [Planoprotostelium fungivorum]|uniref:Uncharacterized protein n=1 Tax=Planoprotostelium fungivorum TaxID=1890364 RepID=A0A2P6NMH7_9EUKA|nr:hypothetical protein PROFUN_07179 [Planoprotostelium fungivorum]